ncbi:inorganic triphosphatase [mine drainage metagenome]|uniref:Inorganic triphosphatase n=1 Tax=mine drainage metagenome TaxID=410659 RepID=A0A1J5PWS3_9ZZZZ
MAKEDNRKFLVKAALWRAMAAERSIGRVICRRSRSASRARIAGPWFSYHQGAHYPGVRRLEFEYPIPLPDAMVMLDQLCERTLIEKTRHREVHCPSATE